MIKFYCKHERQASSHTDVPEETISMTTDTESLSGLVEFFDQFIRAIGYKPNGHLELVEDE